MSINRVVAIVWVCGLAMWLVAMAQSFTSGGMPLYGNIGMGLAVLGAAYFFFAMRRQPNGAEKNE